MMIIDSALARRAAEGRPIRVGMVGAGFMARGIALQMIRTTPGMDLVAIANRTPEKAVRAYREAGLEATEVTGRSDLDAALATGRPVVTDDPHAVINSEQVDVLVDATGAVEFGARITVAAFERGLPVVSTNAELDGTIGPLLSRLADKAGVVFTGMDGDQPGVQGNLLRFVRGMGMEPLVAGNIKGLQDEYRTPTTQQEFARTWGQDAQMVTSFADGTKVSFEQATVANAYGFTVPRRGMNGWDHPGHVDELTRRYDVDELRALGGIVDYVVGAKPSPGVYVLATQTHPIHQHYLKLYKLGDGPLYSFYTPYHLCHFEVPSTVCRAVDFADAALRGVDPRVDVVTTAKRDLAAGHTLDGLGGYDTYGVAESAATTREEDLLPMGLAGGCVLRGDIAKDQVITRADVTLPEGRLIDALRAEQDAIFAPAG
ncbi:MAG: NAD(P)H-dependent oxidoreductase [Propionibacteriaceae bacterium]